MNSAKTSGYLVGDGIHVHRHEKSNYLYYLYSVRQLCGRKFFRLSLYDLFHYFHLKHTCFNLVDGGQKNMLYETVKVE